MRKVEKLPRFHDDAVLIGEMSEDTSCVFAFGPDAHYEAIVHRLGDGCVLTRRLSDDEIKFYEKKKDGGRRSR